MLIFLACWRLRQENYKSKVILELKKESGEKGKRREEELKKQRIRVANFFQFYFLKTRFIDPKILANTK